MATFLEKFSTTTSAVSADRYQGGVKGVNPFIKGYFYVFFGLPVTIFKTGSDNITQDLAKTYLLSSAEMFTPHADRQINFQDLQGMGGAGGASFISGQTITRDFSIQYKDYWSAPIFRIHRLWTSYLDPYLGVSTIASSFTPNEYKGTCMVIQTKPVAKKIGDNPTDWTLDDIIKINYYDGVQCVTDLSSVYDANIADNSVVKPTVQYKFDGFPLTELNNTVKDAAVKILNNASVFTKTAEIYTNLSAAAGSLTTGATGL